MTETFVARGMGVSFANNNKLDSEFKHRAGRESRAGQVGWSNRT